MTEKTWTDETWEKRDDVIYRCEVSALYHRKRERFFSNGQRIANVLALTFGAIGFSSIASTGFGISMAVIAAAVAIISIVFGWSDRATAHAGFAARFITLRAEIEAAGVVSDHQIDLFSARALAIESEEPPALSALVRICQNELARASGHLTHVQPLRCWERLGAQFVDFQRLSTTRDPRPA